jgi:hypothetical protein
LKKIIAAVVTIACGLGISACGGGGAGGGAGQDPEPQQPVIVVPSINVSSALVEFLDDDKSNANLASNDGSLGWASLSVKGEIPSSFVTNGSSAPTTFVRTLSLLESSASGRLLSRHTWKLHLDANVKPIGLGVGHADAGFTDCMSVAVKNELPTASNVSGVYFSGVQSTSYSESYRNGTLAHYCDTTPATAASVMWSVEAGKPNPYACLTMPASHSTPKAKLCIPVTAGGAVGMAMWVRIYRADGSVAVDYKDAGNAPVENYSSVIDQKNYYYGTVWRPSDGFVYQTYPATKFSSEQACRNQTVIDWKKSYSADNIGWSCVNVKSN